jgi:hypothetical protein
MNDLPAILTAATALIAVFLGPFLAYWYAKRQAVGTMREKWLSELREELTQLLGQADEMLPVLVPHRGINKDYNDQYRRLVDHEVKIRLMLTSRRDEDHQALTRCASDVVALFDLEDLKPEAKQERFVGLKTRLIEAGQKVLKTAWIQVLE